MTCVLERAICIMQNSKRFTITVLAPPNISGFFFEPVARSLKEINLNYVRLLPGVPFPFFIAAPWVMRPLEVSDPHPFPNPVDKETRCGCLHFCFFSQLVTSLRVEIMGYSF